MLRIDRRISVILSYGFCILALIGVCAIAVVLVFDTALFALVNDGALFVEQTHHGIWTYLFEYLILALVAFSDICLMLLLGCVKTGKIFTDRSVQYLRYISWASILAGLCAIPLFFLLRLISLLAIAFVGFFLGVVLRVVKNVIEEGTAIKEENDWTI